MPLVGCEQSAELMLSLAKCLCPAIQALASRRGEPVLAAIRALGARFITTAHRTVLLQPPKHLIDTSRRDTLRGQPACLERGGELIAIAAALPENEEERRFEDPFDHSGPHTLRGVSPPAHTPATTAHTRSITDYDIACNYCGLRPVMGRSRPPTVVNTPARDV